MSYLIASNSRRPAGWYPDPQFGGGYRWWDGHGWTPNVVTTPPNTAL